MSGANTTSTPGEELALLIYQRTSAFLSGRPLATVIEGMYLATLVMADEITDRAIHVELLNAIKADCERRIAEIEAGDK